MAAHTAPELSSWSASSSRIRRRTGSPSTSNAFTPKHYITTALYKYLWNKRAGRPGFGQLPGVQGGEGARARAGAATSDTAARVSVSADAVARAQDGLA